MGYGIDKYCENIKGRLIIFLTVLIESVVIVLGITYIKIFTDNPGGVVSVFQLFVPLLAIDFFVIFKVGCKSRNSKMISNIGQAVFGIYLIEDLVRNQIEKIINKLNLIERMNDFIVAILFVITTFFICCIILVPLILIKNLIRKNRRDEKHTKNKNGCMCHN